MNTTAKVVMLVTDCILGKLIVPKVHKHYNLISIVIFCNDDEEDMNWAKEFKNVSLVTKSFDEALEKSKKLLINALKI